MWVTPVWRVLKRIDSKRTPDASATADFLAYLQQRGLQFGCSALSPACHSKLLLMTVDYCCKSFYLTAYNTFANSCSGNRCHWAIDARAVPMDKSART